MSNQENPRVKDVAVIGMSGRFPKARDLAEFWRNLAEGRECATFYQPEDLLAVGADPAVLKDPRYVNASLLLEDIDLFDAAFFGYNAREAETMDPQHRVFLECAWHALEDAGYDPHTYGRPIGVFAGCAMSTYLFQLNRNPKFVDGVGYLQFLIGNDKDYLPTHVSYKLNLKGPSFLVQSACSTGLLAVSLACRSLLEGQCDIALGGAACIRVPQISGYGYYAMPGGIYSPDGRCAPFDADAKGTIFGNGVGVIVLKRLPDAIADGDHIYAVIKGSGINNDGSLKVGYTAPSLDGQAEVIARAHADAGVDPETITYVETHGTGTALGDPIEVAALKQAFQTKKRGFCAIGSVKSNIGHLDPAAGIASLIKTVLALKNKAIPASLHFHRPNPEIDFANSPFYVNAEYTPWLTEMVPRRAGVSAFGIGGTNVHMVLEEALQVEPVASYRPAHLYVISARTPKTLEALTEKSIEHFRGSPNLNLADAAYTSQVGRRGFAHRRVVVCHDSQEAADALESADAKHSISGKQLGSTRRIGFLFSGQGSQYVGMADGIYRVEPVFRDALDRCAKLLEAYLGLDIRKIIFAHGRNPEDAAAELRQTALTQPSLFALEYSLAALWMEWGVRPNAMIGHSLGEFVAACFAGVMSLESALWLIAERGRLMQSLPPGSMLAIPLPEEETVELLDGSLDLAAINEAGMCVVSGPTLAIERLAGTIARRNIEGRHLNTSHAFHSAMMEPILSSFARAAGSVELKAPRIPFVSNVTGDWITDAEATSPDYWTRHLRKTVRFAEGLSCLLREHNVLLEVGPGNTLSSFARRQLDRGSEVVIQQSLRHPADKSSDFEFLLKALGRLWVGGVDVDWKAVHRHDRRRRVSLPLYPFDRKRYWVEAPAQARAVQHVMPSKKTDLAEWFYKPTWKKTLTPQQSESPSRRWLLFADNSDVGKRLAGAMESDRRQVAVVRAADRFRRLGPLKYEINPASRQDYARLFEELGAASFSPDRIVHLWTVESADWMGEKSFDATQESGFYSLLYLAQALLKQRPSGTLRIAAVSSRLHQVEDLDAVSPGVATILGACKCIPQEYPSVRCRSIDIGTPVSVFDEDSANRLWKELDSDADDPVVACRASGRWVQSFEPLRLEARPEVPSLLRERGVYLISGGLGNIGLALAQWLAREVQARVALVSRTALPPRSLWPRILQQRGSEDPVCAKILELQQLENLGGDFLTFAVDIADSTQVHGMIEDIRARFGEVNGVFHAAGTVAVDAFFGIDQATPAGCERHFRPKVRGLLALESALQQQQPDFWVLTSSLSSVLAGLGFASYAAANLFLDSYAIRQRDKEARWYSINWDAWDFRAANAGIKPTDPPMRPPEGVETLRRMLAADLRQVIVSTTDLQPRLDRWIYGGETPQAKPDPDVIASVHARPELATGFVAPQTDTEKRIAGLWSDLLGLDQIGIHDNFFTELGGHSLLATQLVSRLRETFNQEFPVRLLFESATVAELAAVVDSIGNQPEADPEEIPIVALPREAQRLPRIPVSAEPAGD